MAMKEAAAPPAAWADEVSAMTAAACLFHSFSDPSRLVILQHLQLGEHRVVDLTEHLGLSQSTVSKHLASLKDTGLVVSRPEGQRPSTPSSTRKHSSSCSRQRKSSSI